MDQEADLIRKKIETTREDLADNLGALEDKVIGVVTEVKKVGKKLNPIHQTENHPLVAVSVSLVAGALVGGFLGRERVRIGAEGVLHTGDSLWEKIRSSETVKQFDPEIKMLKNVAIGLGIKAASQSLKNAFPKVAEDIEGVLKSAEDKLGLRHSQEKSS